ncbi:AIR synthase related protein [Streptomyces physcomitrii]|uniref:Hydrogenase expression/formation protein HypE n=1 Tax=Streptomyces physcomitrii TaxID=2724184 RepID=A0ABX1HAK9_9ACTN|nr:AIR synthase related protein [Streptomyces physcomitrii]NKI45158.1 hypothetical protein [Streptomyces physcomitrii]
MSHPAELTRFRDTDTAGQGTGGPLPWPAGQVTLGQARGERSLTALFRAALADVSTPEPPPVPAGGRLTWTTGTFTPEPPFWPDGDIGRLAVCATVNALAAQGARPLALSLTAVVEAGLSLERLRALSASVRESLAEAEVPLGGFDLGVVRTGEADQLYLTATGTGLLPAAPTTAPARPGDRLWLTGPLGNHGTHLLATRHQLGYEQLIHARLRPLTGLFTRLHQGHPEALRGIRPVSTGGLAATLTALAEETGLSPAVDPDLLPLAPDTRLAMSALGLEPWTTASEPTHLVVAAPDPALETTLGRHTPEGAATLIGTLREPPAGTPPERLVLLCPAGQPPEALVLPTAPPPARQN